MSSRAAASRPVAGLWLALAIAAFSGCGGERLVKRATPSTLSPLEAPAAGLRLSELGLYADMAQKELATDFVEFEPRFPLWSDGAEKRRYLRLPEGGRIDATDPDHFDFPVGTTLLKEFSKAGQLVETRVIVRTGERASDFFMGAFLWTADESDALFVPDGVPNARGTDHDVPSAAACWTCHSGEPGRVLGFSAVQQPNPPAGLFEVPPSRRFVLPGDETTRAALGYLHSNCAHCHNVNGSARPDTDMDLRLSVADRTSEQTAAYRTTLDRSLQAFDAAGLHVRVAKGRPDDSALLRRMMTRGSDAAMPPLGSETVDFAGIAAVRAWIESL